MPALHWAEPCVPFLGASLPSTPLFSSPRTGSSPSKAHPSPSMAHPSPSCLIGVQTLPLGLAFLNLSRVGMVLSWKKIPLSNSLSSLCVSLSLALHQPQGWS